MTNHLWQSTLFALVAATLTLALRKNRAQVRYWLWFSASLKFFLPLFLLMNLGSQLQVAKTSPPAVITAMEQFAQPFPDTVTPVSATNWTPLLLGLWAAGFLAIAVLRLRGWLRIQSALAASSRSEIAAPVEVRSAPGLLEPGVVGILRPILLLPAGIEQRLTPPQLDAVLAHELCHIRRRDNLFASIHMLVEAIFWFHPLVWWIGSRLVDERELACDQEVLRLGGKPEVYAEAIVNVCKHYVESPLACVSGVTGSDLKKRIEAIMTNRALLTLSFPKKAVLAATGLSIVSLPIVLGTIQAQTVPQGQFEVASIRRCESNGDPDSKGGGGNFSSGRMSLSCQSVMGLIQSTYVLFRNAEANLALELPPIEGGPSWIRSERYTIEAKAENNATQGMMGGPMMQALLEDRFKLKIRRESREVPAYALTAVKSGPKLQSFKVGTCTPLDTTKFPPPPREPGENRCRARGQRVGANIVAEAQGMTVEQFSTIFFSRLDRPVVNKTGIDGLFDFHLEYANDDAPTDEPRAPSIFTALQEQLGLRLDPVKASREFLVIDDIEKPSEN